MGCLSLSLNTVIKLSALALSEKYLPGSRLKFRCKTAEDNLIGIYVKVALAAFHFSQWPLDSQPADHAELLSHGRIKPVEAVIRKRG